MRDFFQTHIQPALPASLGHGIGIIGAGGVVNYGHLPAYRKAGFNVVGIATRSEETLHGTMKQWDLTTGFTDWRRLLDLPGLEVVDITYPFDEERLAIVREAAARGKHMLMQKPLAHSPEAAEEMVRIAEEHGVLLAVNQNARWCPQYRAAQLAIEKGLLGDVYFAIHEMQNTQDAQGWFQERWYAKQPRFQIIEYSVHHLDLMRFWLGKEPCRVKASIARKPNQQSRGEMIASMQLEFTDGSLAIVVDNNASYPQAETRSHFRIEGTNGLVESEAVGQVGFTLQSDRLAEHTQRIELGGQWFPDGFIGTMAELLCAIEEGRQPTISAHDNLQTMRLVFAAYDDITAGEVSC